MTEVWFIGFGGITTYQRQISIRIGRRQSVRLSKYRRLYDGKALLRPIREITSCFFTIKAVKQSPRCIPEIEEGLAILVLQVTVIL